MIHGALSSPSEKLTTLEFKLLDVNTVSPASHLVLEYGDMWTTDSRLLSLRSSKSMPSLPLPQVTRLEQNVPNPFNPVTTISYSLATSGDVSLKIYDASGRLVRTLVRGYQPADRYGVTWNGTNDQGRKMASGIYVYRLEAEGFKEAKKLVLMK